MGEEWCVMSVWVSSMCVRSVCVRSVCVGCVCEERVGGDYSIATDILMLVVPLYSGTYMYS